MKPKRPKMSRAAALEKNDSDVRRANTPAKLTPGKAPRKASKPLKAATKKQIKVSKKLNKAKGRKY